MFLYIFLYFRSNKDHLVSMLTYAAFKMGGICVSLCNVAMKVIALTKVAFDGCEGS